VDPGDSINRTGTFVFPLGLLSISNVQVSASQASATISWRTNSRADGKVEYGLENAGACTYSSTVSGHANRTNQSVTIGGLIPWNPYCYRIIATTSNDSAESAGSFETSGGMPRLEIQSASGPFLRQNSGLQGDTDPWYIEYTVQIANSRSRTPISAYQVVANPARTVLEAPCDQLREPPMCHSTVESVPLSLMPGNPADIPSGANRQIRLLFPVRVPLGGFINASRATLRLGLDYQYAGGTGMLSASRDLTADVYLQSYGLSVTLADSMDPAPLNTALEYTFKVANGGICDSSIGPCDATAIPLSITWDAPQSASFVSAEFDDPASGCAQTGPSVVSCLISSLPTASSITGRLVLQSPTFAGTPNPMRLHAELAIPAPGDPYPYDDAAKEITTIDPSQTPTLVDVSAELDSSLLEAVVNDSCTAARATYTFRNIGTRRLSNLKSVTTHAPAGAVLVNRDSGTPSGIYSELTFPLAGGYSDGVLDPGDSVDVMYYMDSLGTCSIDWRVTAKGHILP
jgi:hypothetical protein